MLRSHSARTTVLTAAALAVGSTWLTARALRNRRRLDLRSRHVLITGGSRGLGLALAREFARQGARVSICARDTQELQSAAIDVGALGPVRAFTCDLRAPDQIANMIADATAASGPVDVLVNNAGVIAVGPAESMTLDDYRLAMDVNFWAAVHTTLAILPSMRSRGVGRIVNVSSVGGKMPVPHLLPYCASKFAVEAFSNGLRAELSHTSVYVTTVNPGLMRTGSPRNATFKGNHHAEYAWFTFADNTPLLSMSAHAAARKIVSAAQHGDGEVTLGLPAKLGAALYGVAPNLHGVLSNLATRLLPRSTDPRPRRGHESESMLTRSPLNFLGHRAERQFNQLRT